MTQAEVETAAQAALRPITAEMESIRRRLLAIHDSLPIPPQEIAMLVGEEEMDVATEVRSIIECVLHDDVEPAIRDLQAAASYQPQGGDT